MNDQTTATEMSFSKSARRQNDAAIAMATRTSVPATWPSETCWPLMGRATRSGRGSRACASCRLRPSVADAHGSRGQPLRLRAVVRHEHDRDALAQIAQRPLDLTAGGLVQS